MKKLNYLIALARIGHFGRAAEACHISQPAFSSAIQHLEEELGVTLVRRGQRFMGLTPAGERVLLRAQRLAADWESLKQEAAASAGQLAGTLRIGVIPTALTASTFFTQAYRKEYPRMHFKLFSLSAEIIFRKLDAFELDLGFTYLGDPRLQGLHILPLYRENYVLLARRSWEGARLSSMTWLDVAKLPLCLLTPNMHNRQLLDAVFRDAGASPNVVVETDSVLTLYAHVVGAGLFTILPHSLLSTIGTGQELIAMPLHPPSYRQIGLIAPYQKQPSQMRAAAWKIAKTLELQKQFDGLISRFD